MMEVKEFIKLVKNLYQTDDFIPLHVPVFRGNEKEYVMNTLETTMVSSVGAYVDKFELDLATYASVPRATAVVNGTAGLQVALRLVGVKPGEEVITQALTFVATANAIHYSFADPVFIDVDLDTMGMAPKALSGFLEEYADLRDDGAYNKKTGKRFGACMPMHTFGFLCRIEEIVTICNAYKIPVVEDAAEALGSFGNGQSAGTFGSIGVFSFNGNKIVTSGGGGALVSNDENLMVKAKHITTTAKKAHAWEYVHDEYAYNFRMPNLNAALVCAQLEKIDDYLENKKALYEAYSNGCGELGFSLKPIPDTTEHWNYWLQAVELGNKTERDTFLKETNQNGVMTRPIWQLMYRLPMYAHCQRDSQTNAEFLEERIVNIPSSVR
jgi:aminotransferase in exopolysaccharide biosynthesis